MDLNAVISHLYENSTSFRRRMDDVGLSPAGIHQAADLSPLPVLRKDDLVQLQNENPPFGGMLAVPPGNLKRVFQSPGPINEPEANRPDYWRWESAFHAAGFREGDVVLNAFSYHLTPAGAMFEEGLRAVGCPVIPGGVGNQEQQLQVMAALGAVGYVGLPSYLKSLLDKAQELNSKHSLQRALVTAEPLPPSLRAELQSHGLKVYQTYGTAECGNLGFECAEQDGWHIPEDVIVQICDINDGQPLSHGDTGEVVVTLYNPDYALVRFGVGDLSAINPEPCPCGRASLRLAGWQGRVGAATKVRGMFLHPTQLSALMRRFPEVKQYQAVVTRYEHLDALALHIVLAKNTESSDIKERLQKAAREALKFRLSIVSVTDLPEDAPPILDKRTWE